MPIKFNVFFKTVKSVCLQIISNEKPLNSIYTSSLYFIRSEGSKGLPVNSADNISGPRFADAREYQEAYDGNEWWQYFIKSIPAHKRPLPHLAVASFRHQFAVFGGEQRPVTFLLANRYSL